MKKLLTRLGVIAATTVAVAVVPVPASATTQVWSCHLQYNSTSAWAWCDFGLGGVRAAGYCWNGSFDVYRVGPWKPAGQTSIMTCVQGDVGEVLDGAWYETF